MHSAVETKRTCEVDDTRHRHLAAPIHFDSVLRVPISKLLQQLLPTNICATGMVLLHIDIAQPILSSSSTISLTIPYTLADIAATPTPPNDTMNNVNKG